MLLLVNCNLYLRDIELQVQRCRKNVEIAHSAWWVRDLISWTRERKSIQMVWEKAEATVVEKFDRGKFVLCKTANPSKLGKCEVRALLCKIKWLILANLHAFQCFSDHILQTMLLLLLVSQLGSSSGEFVCEATGFYPHEDCSQVLLNTWKVIRGPCVRHNFDFKTSFSFYSFSAAPTCGALVSSSNTALNAPKALSSIRPLASVTGPRWL